MHKLAQIWSGIQQNLLPRLAEVLDPLSDKQRELIAILELCRIEDYVPEPWWSRGRKPANRQILARAFVARMVYNLPETRQLLEQLKSAPNLRRICGWERRQDVPSEATFSRAFAEFAASQLPQRVHAALIAQYESPRLVGHLSRDSTDIVAREKPAPREKKTTPAPAKRGRPRQGEARPVKEPTRLARQAAGMTLAEMWADLPCCCAWGTKKKHGGVYHWPGYKLHIDWADGEIPVSVLLTSASLHDSQAAIPLAVLSAARVTSLYDLMDAAYDAPEIKEHSRGLGHVPLIDGNRRRGEKSEMAPAAARRFDERTTAERGFSLFKEKFGGGAAVRVRGAAKVGAQLMFGIVALTAERLLNLLC